MTDKPNEPTAAEQARALIEADKLTRAQGALEEFNAFITDWRAKWRCELTPVTIIRGGQVAQVNEVNALD